MHLLHVYMFIEKIINFTNLNLSYKVRVSKFKCRTFDKIEDNIKSI